MYYLKNVKQLSKPAHGSCKKFPIHYRHTVGLHVCTNTNDDSTKSRPGDLIFGRRTFLKCVKFNVAETVCYIKTRVIHKARDTRTRTCSAYIWYIHIHMELEYKCGKSGGN